MTTHPNPTTDHITPHRWCCCWASRACESWLLIVSVWAAGICLQSNSWDNLLVCTRCGRKLMGNKTYRAHALHSLEQQEEEENLCPSNPIKNVKHNLGLRTNGMHWTNLLFTVQCHVQRHHFSVPSTSPVHVCVVVVPGITGRLCTDRMACSDLKLCRVISHSPMAIHWVLAIQQRTRLLVGVMCDLYSCLPVCLSASLFNPITCCFLWCVIISDNFIVPQWNK